MASAWKSPTGGAAGRGANNSTYRLALRCLTYRSTITTGIELQVADADRVFEGRRRYGMSRESAFEPLRRARRCRLGGGSPVNGQGGRSCTTMRPRASFTAGSAPSCEELQSESFHARAGTPDDPVSGSRRDVAAVDADDQGVVLYGDIDFEDLAWFGHDMKTSLAVVVDAAGFLQGELLAASRCWKR